MADNDPWIANVRSRTRVADHADGRLPYKTAGVFEHATTHTAARIEDDLAHVEVRWQDEFDLLRVRKEARRGDLEAIASRGVVLAVQRKRSARVRLALAVFIEMHTRPGNRLVMPIHEQSAQSARE
jgi:hypothetical protein